MDTIRNNLAKIYQTHEKQNLLLSEANIIKEQVPWMNSNNTQFINQMPRNISHFRSLLIQSEYRYKDKQRSTIIISVYFTTASFTIQLRQKWKDPKLYLIIHRVKKKKKKTTKQVQTQIWLFILPMVQTFLLYLSQNDHTFWTSIFQIKLQNTHGVKPCLFILRCIYTG